MLTLISKGRSSSYSARTGQARVFPLSPALEPGTFACGIEEEEIVARLRRLAAARLHTQCAFEHGVHLSETLQADLSCALEQGQEDLARRLMQALSPVTLEREALSLQVEAIDQESRSLRMRLNRLRRVCPGHPEFRAEPGDQWLDAEMLRRRQILHESPPGDA